MSGVAITRSKSDESLADLRHHVVAAGEIGAGLAGLALLLALGEDEHANGLVRCRVAARSRLATIWSACFGFTPNRTARSTVSSNLAYLAFLTKAHRLVDRVLLRAVDDSTAFARFLGTFGIVLLGDRGLSSAGLPPGLLALAQE